MQTTQPTENGRGRRRIQQRRFKVELTTTLLLLMVVLPVISSERWLFVLMSVHVYSTRIDRTEYCSSLSINTRNLAFLPKDAERYYWAVRQQLLQ